MMKNILILIIDLILAVIIIGFVIFGEYSLLCPIMGKDYSEWLIVILILSFFGLSWLNGKIIKILLPNFGQVKNPNYKDDDCDNNA